MATACHTRGSFSYHVMDQDTSAVFTVDTLFVGGCGRFFEGTAQEMYTSLIHILGKLPPKTLIFCGHEYTLVFAFNLYTHSF